MKLNAYDKDIDLHMRREMQAKVMEGKHVHFWAMDASTFATLKLQEENSQLGILNFDTTEDVWKAFGVTILTPVHRGKVTDHFVEAIT